MKVNHNQYICDRCGKKIRPNQVYDLCPECDKYLEEKYDKNKNAFEKICLEIGEFMDYFTEQNKIHTSVWHIAYIRQRYDHETEWEYTYEPFIYHYGSECDFAMDWWEGQQNVELLGVYSLDHVMDEYRRN